MQWPYSFSINVYVIEWLLRNVGIRFALSLTPISCSLIPSFPLTLPETFTIWCYVINYRSSDILPVKADFYANLKDLVDDWDVIKKYCFVAWNLVYLQFSLSLFSFIVFLSFCVFFLFYHKAWNILTNFIDLKKISEHKRNVC